MKFFCPVLGALLAVVPALARGAELTPGNILVTSGFWGGRKIYEYTPGGTRIQEFYVPTRPGQEARDDNRDVVLDNSGRVIVYNGGYSAGFSALTPSTGGWMHYEQPSMSVISNGTFGKIAAWGDFVFASDHPTGDNPSTGIVRMDINDGSWVLFAPQPANNEAIDLIIGGDGLLYSLNGPGLPSGSSIQAYNPLTLELIETIDLPLEFVYGDGGNSRDLHVDSEGNLYLNQLYGPLYKLSRDGEILGSFSYTRTAFVIDMDLGPYGQVLLTQSDGRVVLLDGSFQEAMSFTTGAVDSFGGWVMPPVPEPSGLAALTICSLLAARRRARRG